MGSAIISPSHFTTLDLVISWQQIQLVKMGDYATMAQRLSMVKMALING